MTCSSFDASSVSEIAIIRTAGGNAIGPILIVSFDKLPINIKLIMALMTDAPMNVAPFPLIRKVVSNVECLYFSIILISI